MHLFYLKRLRTYLSNIIKKYRTAQICAVLYFLYFSLHIDGPDHKAALLVEAHRFIVLRIHTQLQVGTAEGSGQNADLLHHLGADAVGAQGFVHTELMDLHDLPGDSADGIGIAHPQPAVAHHRAVHLRHIQLPIPNQFAEQFFGVQLFGHGEQVGPPGYMHLMDQPCQAVDIKSVMFGSEFDLGNLLVDMRL